MAWYNNDGLFVKFGTEETATVRGGEFNTGGTAQSVFEFEISWQDALSSTAAAAGAQ
jgi:hypothetical protein